MALPIALYSTAQVRALDAHAIDGERALRRRIEAAELVEAAELSEADAAPGSDPRAAGG